MLMPSPPPPTPPHSMLILSTITSNNNTTQMYTVGIEDEVNYAHTGEDEESEEEEEEEEDESINFAEVTEVRFDGEVGPMGDRRSCKIRCVKGKWVGPLCATNEEGKNLCSFLSSVFVWHPSAFHLHHFRNKTERMRKRVIEIERWRKYKKTWIDSSQHIHSVCYTYINISEWCFTILLSLSLTFSPPSAFLLRFNI